MRSIKFIILSFLGLMSNCSQDEKDIIVQNFVAGTEIKLPDNFNLVALSKEFDVNADGHPDYLITLNRFTKDDIYYNEDAFYIVLRRLKTYLQINNPFDPIVLIDDSRPVNHVGSFLALNMARYYEANTAIKDIDKSYFETFLSKKDEYETIQPLGIKYIPMVMNKVGKVYYGWIEVELVENAITIKRMAFCRAADTKIRIGETN